MTTVFKILHKMNFRLTCALSILFSVTFFLSGLLTTKDKYDSSGTIAKL